MAKTDVSDPDLSNPDPSVLKLTENGTPNLNPSKPDIFNPDPPHPDLLEPATSIPAPSPPGLGHDVKEPAIALLTEISASLRELKDFSARFMKLVDLQEAEDLRRRSISRSIGSKTTYSASQAESSDANVDIMEAEPGRRDRRGTTGSDDSDIIVVIERDMGSSEDGTGASTEDPLKGYNQLQTEYGELPHPDLCLQMFDFDASRQFSPPASGLYGFGTAEEGSAWLREKDLVFSRDERCGFTFDTVALAGCGNLKSVQYQIEKIEAFARGLRKNGGFFFFRERYPGEQTNKVYNGTHVFWCPDRMKEALPTLSAERMDFSEDFPEPGERSAIETSNYWLLDRDSILEKRKEATRDLESRGKTRGPRITYHYKGEPGIRFRETHSGFVTDYGNGRESPEKTSCQNFIDPHLTGPWQRLCVLTGLSNIPDLDRDNIWEKVPLFSELCEVDQGNRVSPYTGYDKTSDTTSDETGDEGSENYAGFFEESISQHLDCEQLSTRQSLRRRIVKFQFSWYHLIPYDQSEKRLYRRKYSGRLYRDDLKRSLQLESFMAIASWQHIHEDSSGDCQFWTLVILAPAFFYHRGRSGNTGKDLRHLIAPLNDILPTLSATLHMLISRILGDWDEISEYVENFVAGQDTFLYEDRHDRLLFDDDNFTRSRQYFWVIDSIGEFVPIIDKTIDHYENVLKWVCQATLNSDLRTEDKIGREYNEALIEHDATLKKLKALRERFEGQRNRATALRDGLFNASAVVESRLSTRLGQNVKLLTYVSIFYLPLAFCAALWAIPNITEPSTRTPFAVAAVLVAFVTYFTVFNLDALVSLGWTTYSGFRAKRIEQMTTAEDEKWRNRAQGYKRFVPDRGTTKLSEWYILLYALLHPFGRPGESEDIEKDGEEDSSINSWKMVSLDGKKVSQGLGGIAAQTV